MNELLGEQIRALREAKGFTQEQVATQLGISRQKYARIEKGINNITLDILSRIAAIFDVKTGDITRVLDMEPVVEYRTGNGCTAPADIFEMIDFFYANKRLYARLKQR